VPKRDPQLVECVDKEQFKIQWLQAFYSVKWTLTQKQIPRENEKFNLLSAIKFVYSMSKIQGPFFWEFDSGTWILISALAYNKEKINT